MAFHSEPRTLISYPDYNRMDEEPLAFGAENGKKESYVTEARLHVTRGTFCFSALSASVA